MIKVTALYARDHRRFDIDYYCNSHIPMVRKALGSALRNISVDCGISGGMPGSKPPFVAIAQLTFDSMESFQNALGPHAAAFAKDAQNYTDIDPVMQISEVKL